MIPISNLFEDYDEQMVEDLTIQCFYKYGNRFLESLIPFFESGIMTEMDNYFSHELTMLFEVGDLSDYDIKKMKDSIKHSMNIGKKANEQTLGKRSDFRELTHRMSKSKIGRAVVKGVRKVAYGTKLGRKLVRKYADRVDKKASEGIKKTAELGKSAIQKEATATRIAKEMGKNPTIGGIKQAIHLKWGATDDGMLAGSTGYSAKKKLRQAHQLRRNANFIEKNQQKAKSAKTTINGKRARHYKPSFAT